MTDSALQSHFGAEWHKNPFVSISQSARISIVAYFVFWRLLPSFATFDTKDVAYAGYSGAIIILTLCTEFLILLPFLMRRFAGTPIGWLHPLILPTMVGIVFGLMRNPAGLLTPISVWSQGAPVIDHILLGSWSDAALLATQLKVNLMNLLAIISTYAGFAMVRSGKAKRTRRRIRINGFKLAVFLILSLVGVMVFLQQQGGIISHMSTLGGGRYRMREMSGHFLVINRFLPYAILLWYAYRPKALRNPVFLILFAVACLVQFIITGSRSGLFSPVAMLLAVWMFHNHRVPAMRALILGLVAILLLGVLGQVRQSGRSGFVDFSALTEMSVAAAWETSQEELIERRTGTEIAVAALVPEKHGFLYGTTYVAALGFWVPRAIWRDKPRGAGAHASALIYGGLETMDGYSGGGFPIRGAAEAYWNFWYFGILIVFGLFGAVCSAVSKWICRDPGNPFAVIALLIVNFGLTTPSTTAIVPAVQTFVLLYLLYLFVRPWRFSR